MDVIAASLLILLFSVWLFCWYRCCYHWRYFVVFSSSHERMLFSWYVNAFRFIWYGFQCVDAMIDVLRDCCYIVIFVEIFPFFFVYFIFFLIFCARCLLLGFNFVGIIYYQLFWWNTKCIFFHDYNFWFFSFSGISENVLKTEVSQYMNKSTFWTFLVRSGKYRLFVFNILVSSIDWKIIKKKKTYISFLFRSQCQM